MDVFEAVKHQKRVKRAALVGMIIGSLIRIAVVLSVLAGLVYLAITYL